MIKTILPILFATTYLYAADLPTLEQIKKTQDAPVKIHGTGSRESLEPMVDGKIHGKARYYHPNGQLYGVIEWKNGKKIGTHTLYHENGNFDQMLSYVDGIPSGTQLWGNPDGTLKEYAHYKDGKPLPNYIRGIPRGTFPCIGGISFNEIKFAPYPLELAVLKCDGIAGPGLPKPSFDCNLAKVEAEKHICSDTRLANADIEINKIYNELIKILDAPSREKEKTAQLRWLKKRNTCFELDEKEKQKNSECSSIFDSRMHELKVNLAEEKLPKESASEASRIIKDIIGLYCEPGSYVYEGEGEEQGKEFPAIDHLQIDKTDNPHVIFFNTTVFGANGHLCSLAGRAAYIGNNQFVYTEGEGEDNCRFIIKKTETMLEIEDLSSCRSYCGARASFGGGFRFANRIEVKNKNKCPPNFKSKSEASRYPKRKKRGG